MAVSSASGESTSVIYILTISRAELQQLNFDRIFLELEEKGVLSKGMSAIMKSKTASEKSNVLKNVLQAKKDEDFLTFLEIVAAEEDDHFLKPTTEFMAMVSEFPEYEDYCHSLKNKLFGLPFEGTKSNKLFESLSVHPVEEDEFLQQLAYQLPVWQPVARMLGLTASDIEHIECNNPVSQGEKAYKALLQWMQKEGRSGATYDVLLQALSQAKDLNDCRSVTDAWWYAHQYMRNIADQPVPMMTD